jgi:hypothetical protein
MYTLKDNEIGLKFFSSVEFGEDLITQLGNSGVEYTTAEISHLVGRNGCAYLLFYYSRKLDCPMTVLCVPIRYDVDGFATDYYYFPGVDRDTALESEQRWVDAYETARKIVDKEILNPTNP